MRRRFRHLSWTDRIKIETMLKTGHTVREIAEEIGVHISTIYREVKRGVFEHLNTDWTTETRYSPDIAQQRYRDNLKAKGTRLKIGKDHALAQYIETRIIHDRFSPAAVLGEIARKGLPFSTTICKTTLYSYIDKGIFLHLTNKHLVVKGTRRNHYHKVHAARPPKGDSIEKRPESINSRAVFGHWEMDCVEGKKGTRKTLLVLTERKTRGEIIRLMPDQTAKSVVAALDRIEQEYGDGFTSVFQTITVDNGSEFADCAGMERSALFDGQRRTHIYYCHPYSSWERGSNENQNKLIRRFYPKGTDLTEITAAEVQRVERWINHYPRELFGFGTAAEAFGGYGVRV